MIIDLDRAITLIQSGEVVGIPTETVYGLAADTFHLSAVEKTFKLKGRPADNPLIVHICSTDQLHDLAIDIPNSAFVLAKHYWPGPLTVILPKKNEVPDIVTGGLQTVAIRMPNHPLTLELIRHTGPLTAPSGNRSGRPSPTKASHMLDDFSGELPVLDGGVCNIGLESTVLDLTQKIPKILRPGAIDAMNIFRTTGIRVMDYTDQLNDLSKSPGTRYTHYKPQANVEWMDQPNLTFDPANYYILHSTTPPELKQNVIYYNRDFEKLAQNLYDHFRTADHLNYRIIKIERLPANPKNNLVKALDDRISKAIG